MNISSSDPASESPIATAIEFQLSKHDLDGTEFRREYSTPTEWAKFRIDIVLCSSERRIGIECDGAEYHDEFRDEMRDSLILGSGLLDTIWRLPGADIHNHIHDCLCLIAKYDSSIFDERTLAVLETQSSPAVREHKPESAENILLAVEPDRLPARSGYINLRRRTRTDTYSPKRQHWRDLYNFALQHRGISFTDLHKLRLNEKTKSEQDAALKEQA